METHAKSPTSPEYDATDYISGGYFEKDAVAPNLRTRMAKGMRAEAEVEKALVKIGDLRGAADPKGGPAKKK